MCFKTCISKENLKYQYRKYAYLLITNRAKCTIIADNVHFHKENNCYIYNDNSALHVTNWKEMK